MAVVATVSFSGFPEFCLAGLGSWWIATRVYNGRANAPQSTQPVLLRSLVHRSRFLCHNTPTRATLSLVVEGIGARRVSRKISPEKKTLRKKRSENHVAFPVSFCSKYAEISEKSTPLLCVCVCVCVWVCVCLCLCEFPVPSISEKAEQPPQTLQTTHFLATRFPWWVPHSSPSMTKG